MQSITYNRTNSKIYLFMNQSAYVFLLLLTPEICCRLLRPFCFLPCPCPQSSLLFFFDKPEQHSLLHTKSVSLFGNPILIPGSFSQLPIQSALCH